MSDDNFAFAPLLFTERLTLTLYDPNNESDSRAMGEMLLNIGRGVFNLNLDDAKRDAKEALEYYKSGGRIQPSFLGGRTATTAAIWHVRLGSKNPDGEYVGLITVIQRYCIPDQGWTFVPEHRAKGYATEAASEVLRYFREELGIHDIMAPTHPDNLRSRQVAHKLGYVTREGGLEFQDGTLLDLNILPGAMSLPKGVVFKRFA